MELQSSNWLALEKFPNELWEQRDQAEERKQEEMMKIEQMRQ